MINYRQDNLKEVIIMIFVLTDHVVSWLKIHPQWHRTDQQGQRIVCPFVKPGAYLAEPLHDRPSHVTKCSLCKMHLGRAELILDDQNHRGEFRWPAAV